MKPSYLHLAIATLALALFSTFAAAPAQAEEPTSRTIKAVDVAATTVTIEFVRTDKTVDRTFVVDDSTTITLDGNKATLADLKPGMVVKGFKARDAHTLDLLGVVSGT